MCCRLQIELLHHHSGIPTLFRNTFRLSNFFWAFSAFQCTWKHHFIHKFIQAVVSLRHESQSFVDKLHFTISWKSDGTHRVVNCRFMLYSWKAPIRFIKIQSFWNINHSSCNHICVFCLSCDTLIRADGFQVLWESIFDPSPWVHLVSILTHIYTQNTRFTLAARTFRRNRSSD